MDSDVVSALDFVQGPVFRFCFALMSLGLLRLAMISVTEMISARVTTEDRRTVRHKLWQRFVWFLLPHILLRQRFPLNRPWTVYHVALSLCSVVFRLGAIIVPCFMVAHVYLWEQALGVSWPSLPARVGDAIAFITIAAGFVVFLCRLYSPLLRKTEPKLSFLTPLVLVLPFCTGVLAMHPTWSPISYPVMMLLHVLSACLVFVLLPFTGLLSFMHCRIARWVPQAAWREPAAVPPQASAPAETGKMVLR